MAQFSTERAEAGHAAVVHNGHHLARLFQTGIGPGAAPYVRRTKTLEAAVIPPFSTGCCRRVHAAIFSFKAGVMAPMPMSGRSLL